MRGSFRQSDLIIRYGGDEFAVMLLGASLEQATEVAERFITKVCREIHLPNGSPLTVSVGITKLRPEDDFMSFLSRADEALYMAKYSGKNRVVAVE